MVKNDTGISEVTHKVNEAVCRLMWEGNVDADHLEKIAHEISPGPKPEYRCCVYKEREIVRHRIRLACQKNADIDSTTTNVVQVIKPACDDCTSRA